MKIKLQSTGAALLGMVYSRLDCEGGIARGRYVQSRDTIHQIEAVQGNVQDPGRR